MAAWPSCDGVQPSWRLGKAGKPACGSHAELRAQQVMDAPITKPAAYMGDVHDAFAQNTGELIWLWWVAIAVTA